MPGSVPVRPRLVGRLTVTLHTWQRARRCPLCDTLTRVLVTAETVGGTAYAYCPACWGVTEAAYAAWSRTGTVSAP